MICFEDLLIQFCAPTLLGIKQANLFSYPAGKEEDLAREIDKFNALLNHKDIFFKILYSYKTKHFVIIYRKQPMLTSLKNSNVQQLLQSIGYPPVHKESEIDSALEFLGGKIESTADYPHEIGFFLGYPLEDVFQFIYNNGENYKLIGYWKVYSNEEKAIKTFKQYKKCRDVLYRITNSGTPILKLLGVA